MEKVKVKRYVSGKRPDYAPMESSEEEDEEFQFIKKAKEQEVEPEEQEEELANDPRLRRLQNRIAEDVEERWVLRQCGAASLARAGVAGPHSTARAGGTTGTPGRAWAHCPGSVGESLTVLTDMLYCASGVGSARSCPSNPQSLFARAQPLVQLQSGNVKTGSKCSAVAQDGRKSQWHLPRALGRE